MSSTPKRIIEESTNYAFALRKKQAKGGVSFQSIRDTSIQFFQMLPDDLRNELYNEIQRGICPLDSEPRLNAYMFSFGKMHNAKLRRAYDNLSPEFRQHQTIDIVDYGCGQAMGCICYADFLRENGIRQRVRRVVLIEPSELALARAALHVSLLFPDAEIRTVCKGFDDLLPEELCSDVDVPTLHILSNVLDLGDKFYGLDKFADLVSDVLKGDNEFVCVGPRYGNQNDLKTAQFMERIGAKTYYATQYRTGELAAGETWTGILCCGSKHEKKYELDCELSNGLTRVRCSCKYGCIDKTGKVVIPMQFNGIYTYRDNLLKVEYNDKHGLYNAAGEQITPIKYDEIEGFHIVEIKRLTHCHCGGWETCEFDGNEDIRYHYAKVRVGDKWGIINPDGKEITPIKYNCIESIAQANEYWNENAPNYVIAKVSIDGYCGPDNDNCLYIDTEGRERPIYDEIQDFGEGLKLVRLNDKYGLIDKTSKKVVTPIIYDEIGWKDRDECYWYFSDECARVELDGKYGIIDIAGKEIIPLKYDDVDEFSNGFACVRLNDKWGVIDTNGKEVAPLKYDFVGKFSDGFACVELNDRWGIIDTNGKEVTPLKYDAVHSFCNGLARVKLNGKCGFIDKKIKEVIPIKYDDARDFNERLAPVKLHDKWGLIDKAGETIAPIKYDDAYSMYEYGLTKVKLNNKYGFVDKTGKEITSIKYDKVITSDDVNWSMFCGVSGDDLDLPPFRNIFAKVRSNDKWGCIDATGKEIVPAKYDEFIYIDDVNIVVVVLNNKYGILNNNGEEISAIIYDDYKFIWTDYYFENLAVSINGKWGLIDTYNGRKILPIKYEEIRDVITREFKMLAVVKLNGKWGIIDLQEQEIISIRYDNIESSSYTLEDVMINGIAMVGLYHKWGVIDKTGKEIVSLQYDKEDIEIVNSKLIRVRENGEWKDVAIK